MKTTIDLPDGLFERLKSLARSSGVPMREVIIDGLTTEIERRSTAPSDRPDLFFPTAGGAGTAEGIDPTRLTELAYDLPGADVDP